ncbi:class I SAM-dependent methyltransferase [Paenibacillus sp. GCM10023252]|uniref:class I SAM-dependent methyltransferase n=1 Tax=Paenibacillus sp. GCM10023252 TaxID=3252649 RepID=UPI00361AE31D
MSKWYEQSFGADYMVVYKHRDWSNAYREVQMMAEWLTLPAGAEVLDIGCGMGRHALALADCGLQVTGIDLSQVLLSEAVKHDTEQRVTWLRGDMRELPFEGRSFDATVNLFTSFGYFEEDEDNNRVLREIRRVLRSGGSFLIDFLNPTYVQQHLVPSSERVDDETGLRIVEKRRIHNGWVMKDITVSRQGGEDERTYMERVRLLPLAWFEEKLSEAGLLLQQAYGNYDGSPYDPLHSPRMIMVGKADGCEDGAAAE